jgi:hypothetical protein
MQPTSRRIRLHNLHSARKLYCSMLKRRVYGGHITLYVEKCLDTFDHIHSHLYLSRDGCVISHKFLILYLILRFNLIKAEFK